MCSVFLRCAKVCQTETFVWFANLAAFFFTAQSLKSLSDLPSKDPSTEPHIQESDSLVTRKLNFSCCCSVF